MKNLNIYGDKLKEIIISEGRLEDINDFHKIIYISVTESNTDHLINLDVLTHSEEIYIYNNEKYKLDVYTEQECNELFTFPKSLSQDKKEDLIDAFLDNPYENLNDYLDNYNIKYITESDYNTSSYLSMDFIRETLEENIMDNNKEYQKWLEIVFDDGLELENVPADLRTYEMCFEAINDHSGAFEFVPEELKTKEMCETVLRYDGYQLINVPEELKTKEMCEIALENIYDEALEEMCLENDVPEQFRKELAEKYDIELPNKTVERGR